MTEHTAEPTTTAGARPARPKGRHVVCTTAELPPGDRRIVTIRGREIGVFNVDGVLRAVTNRCPHHQAPLCLGPVTEEIKSAGVGTYDVDPGTKVLRCPWHSFEFDMATGKNISEPDRYRVKVYEAAAEGDEVVVYM